MIHGTNSSRTFGQPPPTVSHRHSTRPNAMKRIAFHHPPIDAELAPRLFARLPTVLHATGLGRSTLYRLVAAGSFPAPIRLGARAVAWRWVDIDHWSSSRPSTHR